jgi:hypothetical protein
LGISVFKKHQYRLTLRPTHWSVLNSRCEHNEWSVITVLFLGRYFYKGKRVGSNCHSTATQGRKVRQLFITSILWTSRAPDHNQNNKTKIIIILKQLFAWGSVVIVKWKLRLCLCPYSPIIT